MLLSVNWLRDYLTKTDVRIDPYDLADALTMRGLAVSSVQKKGSGGLDNVVVGRIEKIEKHPNADRLQITFIQTSTKSDSPLKQIVCGAKNIAVGDIVPVALVGAVLPGDFVIKQSQIRGVDSSGMLCSSKELGINDDSEGILQLPKHSVLGEPVARLLGASGGTEDEIIEFELTPNRGDCLSIIGLAREISPLLKTRIRDPKPARFRVSPHRTSSILKVEVEDPAVCPRYVARVIDTIKVTESPDWIKQRLQTVGIKPINNIVDVTNFVMMEYGIPLHAFDLRKIESGAVKVATCKTAQPFTLLNGETVELQPGDILIQDGERPIALAGIMGGANSQIQEDSTSIMLEAACFLPSQIRKTAKRLGLISEAAKRFEKGVDISTIAMASERAAALLRDSYNANVYHPAIDTCEDAPKETLLAIDMREVRKIIGMHVSSETVAELLESIGIISHKKSTNIISVKIPSYRLDLKESIDIIEEIARLGGYDAIPEKTPHSVSAFDRWDESAYELEFRIKSVLSTLGFRETIHYSFGSEEWFSRLGMKKEGSLSITNPISEEMKMMRTSLLPALVATYKFNKNRKVINQRLFEVGRAYFSAPDEETKAKEIPMVAGLISGNIAPENWHNPKEEVDFYLGKGVVETLVKNLSTVFLAYEPLTNHPLFHPRRAATLKLGVREIGVIGEIHPYVKSHILETNEPVILFELNWDALRKYERTQIKYKTPSKFPAIDLDLAFVMDKSVASHEVIETIKQSAGNLLSDISIFDNYEGKNLPEGKKSLGFRLFFQAADKTLQDNEVVALKDKVIQNVSEKHQAQLRA